MKKLKSFPCLLLAFSLVATAIVVQVSSQSSTICSGAMTRSFTPCMNYLMSSSTSSSPTEACCTSLRNLMSNGQDCLCLIVTGGVLFQLPFNQALALSLPRACKMAGLTIECKAPSIEELPQPYLPPESDVIPALTRPGMRPTLFPSAAHSYHSALPSLFALLGVFFELDFHFM